MNELEGRLAVHLQRAGDLLRGNQLEEADREVAEALRLRSDDIRARNLLGLVRFRAGRHDEALTLYRELVARDGDDASLLLNLGLVELRMGKHREAAVNLARVIAKEPQNLRAHGYFGLALMRSGELRRAREAFVQAGQHDLVQQVDERMGREGSRSVTRAAAEGGIQRITDGGVRTVGSDAPPTPAGSQTPLEADPYENAAGEQRLAETPLDSLAYATSPVSSRRIDLPLSVAEFTASRLLVAGPPGEPFVISDGGMLIIRVEGRLPTRTFGAVASSGQLTFEPMTRRVRGRATDEAFGVGVEALFLTSGHGVIVVAPHGARFTALALKDDIVYLREPALFAFEESLHWESGRIPGSGANTVTMVQLRGVGNCVLRSARAASCLQLIAGDVLFVSDEALLGWSGRIVPRQLRGSDGEAAPYIECTGDGALILEEPAPP